MATIVGALAHKTSITGPNNAGFQISANAWNATIAASGVVADGALAVRDSTQPDGWGWQALPIPDTDLSTNIPLKNAASNVFTGAIQLAASAPSPALILSDTSQGSNLKNFSLFAGSGKINLYSTTDAGAAIIDLLTVDRSGNVALAGAITPVLGVVLTGSGASPSLEMDDTSQGLNLKRFVFVNTGGKIALQTITDVGALIINALTVDRSGNAVFAGTVACGAINAGTATITSGAINTTGAITLTGTPGSPSVAFNDTSQGANLKVFTIFANAGVLNFEAVTDAGAALLTLATMNRSGGMAVTGGFGCNAATPQTPVASGGALATYGAGANGFDTAGHASALYALVVAIRAALVGNGIMS